eukprot:GHVS01085451.1.p1 GENE.GHVS01085451.1~~GHVS01085451.1.p1  ORF type:complete len:441 (+),score=48.03 GHVS01085451.1:233-1555(+)
MTAFQFIYKLLHLLYLIPLVSPTYTYKDVCLVIINEQDLYVGIDPSFFENYLSYAFALRGNTIHVHRSDNQNVELPSTDDFEVHSTEDVESPSTKKPVRRARFTGTFIKKAVSTRKAQAKLPPKVRCAKKTDCETTLPEGASVKQVEEQVAVLVKTCGMRKHKKSLPSSFGLIGLMDSNNRARNVQVAQLLVSEVEGHEEIGMKDLVTYALEKTEVNVDSLQDALPSVTESQAKEMTVPHDSKQPTSPEGLSQAIAQFPRVVFGRWKQPGMPFPEDPPSAATFDVTSMDNLKYTARDKTTGTVNTLMCDPNFKECSFMAEFKTGIVKFFASQHLEGWEEEEVEKPVIPLSVEEQEVLKGEKGELYGGSGIVIDDINVLIVVNEKLPTEDVETAVTKFAEQYIQLLRKFDECWSFRLIKIRKIGQRDLRLSVAKVMANYVF